MQIGELAARVDVPYRTIRYALERGHADRWVRGTDGSGHYRDLTDGEAFALALLLKLKLAGLRMRDAERVVELVDESLRFVASGFGWDHEFHPFLGQLRTSFQWFLEVGDGRTFRLRTNANPSRGGQMEDFPWTSIATHRTVDGFKPCVTIGIDLTRLAALVGKLDGGEFHDS